MLAIEVGDLPEPFDEADVVGESLTSLRSADDERRRVEACQRLRVRSQREFRVTAENLSRDMSVSRRQTYSSEAPDIGGNFWHFVIELMVAAREPAHAER